MKKIAVILGLASVAMAVAPGVAVAEDKKVKLNIDLPKALFVGTPKKIASPNLDKKFKSPEIMVPKGTKNVALDKEVTGSDSFPVIGELELITDGDKEGSDGSYVELGPGKQHVQIDLGKKHTVYAIALWHYHSQARVYYDVVAQISDDPDFVKSTELFNNDHDNSLGLGAGKQKEYVETNKGMVLDAKGKTGRYVRLYSNGSTSSEMNHYIEVEIFGKEAK